MKNLQNRSGPVLKVSESRLNKQKLKGKPKCPRCGNSIKCRKHDSVTQPSVR